MLHSLIIMNPGYPFYLNIDQDQTNLNEAQDRYRPGQFFWRWNQSENHQQIAEIPLLQRRQFWRHFNPCSHKPAFLAVDHWLQLVSLRQQHQNPKIHPRQKIRKEQAEGMENGGMKRRGFWCNYGATST